MTRIVRFRADAEVDLQAAMAWYDSERKGLGDELLDEAQRVLTQIAKRAASFPEVIPPFRRALLSRFPYAIYFLEVAEDTILVFAVFHARRDPRELERRLAQ